MHYELNYVLVVLYVRSNYSGQCDFFFLLYNNNEINNSFAYNARDPRQRIVVRTAIRVYEQNKFRGNVKNESSST